MQREMQSSRSEASAEELAGFPNVLSDDAAILTFLRAGYDTLDQAPDRLSQALNDNDANILAELLQAFPATLPRLDKALSAGEFKTALDWVCQDQEVDIFALLHRHFVQLFNQEAGGPNRDAIRDAIADEDIHALYALATKIQPGDILFDDVQTALMLEAFDIFAWLYQRANLSDEEILTLAEYASSDQDFFERLFHVIRPDSRLLAKIRTNIAALDEPNVLAFLDRASSSS